MNLSKERKELYTEIYKKLMTGIKDDMNRWRDIPCPWVGRINIVEITILSNAICKLNAIHRLNAIPIKLPMAFFTNLEQEMFKFV